MVAQRDAELVVDYACSSAVACFPLAKSSGLFCSNPPVRRIGAKSCPAPNPVPYLSIAEHLADDMKQLQAAKLHHGHIRCG
jgi:hypothetical protein